MAEVVHAPWAEAAATRAVMAALAAAGGEGCARFVGGCVRNTLLDRPVDDVDIATTLTPDEVMAALTAADVRWVPTGVDHGTVTAISEGRPFEITTLRRDVETDGRRAVVAFTRDWAEDAGRRDFRLNALYMDASGRVFDPLGHGLADVEAGRIVFVGDAATRIREDHLRILRYFRFLAWYGRGQPDAQALAACAALKDTLPSLPAERTAKELLKLLAADDPRLAVDLMRQAGILDVVLPGADPERLARLAAIELDEHFSADAELRLAALTPPGQAGRTAERLRLSNAQRDRLLAAAEEAPPLTASLDARALRRMLYRAGARTVCDRVKLAWADAPDQPEAWRDLLAQVDGWTRPTFPLGGQDAIAAGLQRGPLIGQALGRVEDWWVAQDFPADRSLALAELARTAASLDAS